MAFEINSHHKRWASNAKQRYGRAREYYLELVRVQEGRCAFSDVPLLFDAADGTPVKGGHGCHPLYAALDHRAPGSDEQGHHVVCYALNDLKGHLPHDCFIALVETAAWQRLMAAWRHQASLDSSNRKSFYALVRPRLIE